MQPSSREYNFYTTLKDQKSSIQSDIPKSIRDSDKFKALIANRIIIKQSKGAGYIYKIKDSELFLNFYHKLFPNPELLPTSQANIQAIYKNTKAVKLQSERYYFLRGSTEVEVNGHKIDLSHETRFGNLFCAPLQQLKVKNLCFVENFESFLQAEELLGEEYSYIHFYGRLPGVETLRRIETEKYLHFGDYDYVGLNEYLKAKTAFNNASIYIPDNYEALHEKYATQRKEKDTEYENIKQSNDNDVKRIASLIKQGSFLEQQILFADIGVS